MSQTSKVTHKRSPGSWLTVIRTILSKPRRFWPINTRPVDEEHDGDVAGAKTERLKVMINDYNAACSTYHLLPSDRIQTESTMHEYLNDAIMVGRRVKAAYDQPARVTHHNSWMKQASEYQVLENEAGAAVETTVFRDTHEMDFALVPPVETPAEGPAVDWKALKVKNNPSLEKLTETEKLEYLREIASYLLNIAEEADRDATGIDDMNLDQWQEYVRHEKERVTQVESGIMVRAGAANMPPVGAQPVLPKGAPPEVLAAHASVPKARKRKRKASDEATFVSTQQNNNAAPVVNPPQAVVDSGGTVPSLQSNSQANGIAQARNSLILQLDKKFRMKEEDRRMKTLQEMQESCMELLADQSSYTHAANRDELCEGLGLNLTNPARFKSSATAIFLLDKESKQAIAKVLKAGPKVTFLAAFLADN